MLRRPRKEVHEAGHVRISGGGVGVGDGTLKRAGEGEEATLGGEYASLLFDALAPGAQVEQADEVGAVGTPVLGQPAGGQHGVHGPRAELPRLGRHEGEHLKVRRAESGRRDALEDECGVHQEVFTLRDHLCEDGEGLWALGSLRPEHGEEGAQVPVLEVHVLVQ